MDDLSRFETWRQMLAEFASLLGERLASFLPTLVAALTVLLLGWGVARLLAALTRRALEGVGLDRLASRWRVGEALREGGVTAAPSHILAAVVFWLLLLVFAFSAAEILGLSGVRGAIGQLVAYVPSLLGGALILLVGVILGRFARGVAASSAAAARLPTARRLGALVQAVIWVTALIIALEQVGLATSSFVIVVGVLLAGMTLSFGVAFALGARPVITHILAGHFLRQSLESGSAVEIRGRRGTLERVGPVDTLLRSDEEVWSVPNGQLLEETITRSASPPGASGGARVA